MNNLTMTKKADSDCCVDETTWGFSGYMAEVGGRLMNKKVDKGMSCSHHVVCRQCSIIDVIIQTSNHQLLITGGKTTMIFDISNRYPRGYVHSSQA